MVAPERVALSPEEAAHALGVSRGTIFNLMRAGELPSARIGAARRISADAILRLVTDGRVSRTRP